MKMDLQHCSKALAKLSDFLVEFHPMINICMVDFITKDLFSRVMHRDLADELSHLTDDQIITMPEKCSSIQTAFDPSAASALDQLLFRLSSHNLESLKVSTSRDSFLSRFKDQSSAATTLQFFDRIASDKKMHEVVVMSDVISRLSATSNVDSVIDLGSGKGYLSHVFAATHRNLSVVAIEGSDKNSESALKRKMKLEKRWDGLLRRALCRASGLVPPTRGKKWKAQQAKTDTTEGHSTTHENGFDQAEVTEAKAGDDVMADNLRFVTEFVDVNTDINQLMALNFPAEVFPAQEKRNFGIVGLHTCGSLATSSIKIFLAKEGARFCCNVGCCYHLVEEGGPEATFPVSSVLKSRNFVIGRNPLMLAAQPMDRSIANKELPDRSLLWRSILQVLLLRHYPGLTMEQQQVGRIAAKSVNFLDYVRRAIEKLQLPIQISDDEITSTFEELEAAHGRKLIAFYQLRSLFAPLVEGLVLLDRLVFLLEQENVSEADLVKLFDPVISPRCYALVAIKKS